ncbi:MAG: hypothetical protein QME58_02760 [Bacteroidota bacterium]|nr:hypothetical protein [Bacteroidota bacterium]
MGHQNKYPWNGIILIFLGVALLIHQTGLINIRFYQIIWIALALWGFIITIRGFATNSNGKVFWGTALFLTGISFIIHSFNLIEMPHRIFLPAVFIIFGFAFLMMFVNNFREYSSFILSIIFFVIGGLLILAEIGYLNRWDVLYYIKNYWPIILIILGAGLILKRKQKRLDV